MESITLRKCSLGAKICVSGARNVRVLWQRPAVYKEAAAAGEQRSSLDLRSPSTAHGQTRWALQTVCVDRLAQSGRTLSRGLGPLSPVSARSHCSQPVLSLLQLWLTVPGLPASPPRLRPPFAPALHTRCLRPCPPDHPPSFSEPSATLLGQPHLSASCTSSTPAPYAPSPAPLNLASADCHDPSRSQSLLHPRPRQFPKPRSSKLPALALSRP